MHIYCKTTQAILVLGCNRGDGVMVFPSVSTALPGIHVAVDQGRPINEQLIGKAVELLKRPDLDTKILINQDFIATISEREGVQVPISLYVGTLSDGYTLDLSAPSVISTFTMPDLMRGMARDRKRLAYLRAWQVLTGALSDNVRAVDLEAALGHLGFE